MSGALPLFVQPGSEPTLDPVRRDNFFGKRQKSGLRSSQFDAERLWRGAIGSRRLLPAWRADAVPLANAPGACA